MNDCELSEISGSLADEILDTVDTPIVILDHEGAIMRFNRASEDLTGYAAAEVTGRKVWEFLIVDEEVSAVKKVFARTQSEGVPTHFTNYWKTKEQKRRLLEWSNKVLWTKDGDVAFILATGIDITDVRSTEHELAESRAFLHAIIDASPVAIITISEKGLILTFSHEAEAIFGYEQNEVVGKNVNLLMPYPNKSQHNHYLERYLATGERRIIGTSRAITAMRKSGEEFPAMIHVSEFKDDERVFVGFVEDVTTQKAIERSLADAQSQMQHANRLGAMGEMAASIAHELNQPLTAAASLAGAVSLMLKKKDDEHAEQAIALLDDTVGEIQRASQIMRQMREFVRTRKTAKSLHDVNKVVEEASAIALIGADSQGVRVTTNFADNVGDANLDCIQIQQVVVNLIRNAIDAMENAKEKRLFISTARHRGIIEVKVEDTGSGIAEDIQKRLFQPFVTSKNAGMGVGLSISKAIIDAHQGEIGAINKESSGCVFSFKIPAGGYGEPEE